VDLKGVFLDDRTRPDVIHQFVLGNELAGRLNQSLDNPEGTRPNGQDNPSRPQLSPREIDLALT
jgi:hypothetical protein